MCQKEINATHDKRHRGVLCQCLYTEQTQAAERNRQCTIVLCTELWRLALSVQVKYVCVDHVETETHKPGHIPWTGQTLRPVVLASRKQSAEMTHKFSIARANSFVLCVVFAACSGPAAPPDAPVAFNANLPYALGTSSGVTAGSTAAGMTGAIAPAATAASAPVSPVAAPTDSPSVTAGSVASAPVTGPSPAAGSAAVGGMGAAATGAAGSGAVAGTMSTGPASTAGSNSAAGVGSLAAGTGAAGDAAAAGSGGMPVEMTEPLPKATSLTLEFTTKAYGGKWGPVNVGAVWIADASGKWVHTLEMWCGWQNTRHLMPYNSAGGPDYSTGLFPGTYTLGTAPPADVIASATLQRHKTHKGASWNFEDGRGTEVPDGMYKLMFEVTEQEDAGKTYEVPFTKGDPPGPIMAPGTAVFTDLNVALQ